jgi:hypothetical protein
MVVLPTIWTPVETIITFTGLIFMPATQDLRLFRGTRRTWRFKLQSSGLTTPDTVGWTTQLTIRNAKGRVVLQRAGHAAIVPKAYDVDVERDDTLALNAGEIYTYSFNRLDVGSEDAMTVGNLFVENDAQDFRD